MLGPYLELLYQLKSKELMNKTILIVDDEVSILMALEYALKKQNFKVLIARDGSEALKIVEEEIPDLVLLDIMMPKVDGYQTLTHIRSTPALKDIKVVLLSAKQKEKDIQKGLDLGADKYLVKPFSIKKIINEINALLK